MDCNGLFLTGRSCCFVSSTGDRSVSWTASFQYVYGGGGLILTV